MLQTDCTATAAQVAAAAPFDAVIDFTGFHRRYMRDVVKALHTVDGDTVLRNVGHYIYISSDSVYMGCDRPFASLRGGSRVRAGGIVDGEVGDQRPPRCRRAAPSSPLPSNATTRKQMAGAAV